MPSCRATGTSCSQWLVEEASAAAESLTEQAANLGRLMARYHVGSGQLSRHLQGA
jgi:hypothetical protein